MPNTNPMIQQGTLNRIRTQVVVPNFTNLNVTASYMGKTMARLTLEGKFTGQIETPTGIVNSPNPFVPASLAISLLRTQALSNAWLQQAQAYSVLGPVTAYSDSSAFQPAYIDNASITDFDPGAFDGSDPVVRVVVRGIFYLNNNLWALNV